MSALPPVVRKHRICVICEGNEDYLYFKRLIDLNLWSTSYSFTPVNAKGASNIPARFQNEFQNDRYEIILVFCDTDKEPYREYSQIKEKINRFLSKRKAAEKLIIFANPCTMQIILQHFGDVRLINQGKKTNSAEIEHLTGVIGYDAHEEQILELCRRITRSNYPDMRERSEAINNPDKSLHSAKKSSREWTELQHRIVGTGTMKINLSNERLASQGSFDLSLTCESL